MVEILEAEMTESDLEIRTADAELAKADGNNWPMNQLERELGDQKNE